MTIYSERYEYVPNSEIYDDDGLFGDVVDYIEEEAWKMANEKGGKFGQEFVQMLFDYMMGRVEEDEISSYAKKHNIVIED